MTMTRQEIYTKVRRHLLAQMQRARSERGTCLYRAGPLKCAVGVLIPDELYTPALENRRVTNYAVRQVLLAADVLPPVPSEEDITFLKVLQAVHDSESPRDWERHLDEIAHQHGLQVEA